MLCLTLLFALLCLHFLLQYVSNPQSVPKGTLLFLKSCLTAELCKTQPENKKCMRTNQKFSTMIISRLIINFFCFFKRFTIMIFVHFVFSSNEKLNFPKMLSHYYLFINYSLLCLLVENYGIKLRNKFNL